MIDIIFQKRRSARNTNKKKKYMDDLDLNLSEEDGDKKDQDIGAVVKPVQLTQFFVVSMLHGLE